MTRLKTWVCNPTMKERNPDVPYVALEHIESGTGRLLPDVELTGKDVDDSVAHRAGDVRFGKLRPYLAKSVLMTEPGVGSGELLVLRPRSDGLSSRYLWYLTLSRQFVEWATATSYGVKMPRTTWDALASFPCELPTLGEQLRVVAHLDAETTRIDELILEQERLAALAAERLHAIREGVFTRHIQNTRTMSRLLQQPPTYGVLVPEFGDDGVPFVRVGDISRVRDGEPPERSISPAQSHEYRRTVLRPGDVVISVVGSLTHSAVVPVDLAGANVARAVAVLRPLPEIPPAIIAHFVRTTLYQDQALLATGTDTAQPTLNMSDLAKFKIPLPPNTDELRTTTDELDRTQEAADALIDETRRCVALLREHRVALITSAVGAATAVAQEVA